MIPFCLWYNSALLSAPLQLSLKAYLCDSVSQSWCGQVSHEEIEIFQSVMRVYA